MNPVISGIRAAFFRTGRTSNDRSLHRAYTRAMMSGVHMGILRDECLWYHRIIFRSTNTNKDVKSTGENPLRVQQLAKFDSLLGSMFLSCTIEPGSCLVQGSGNIAIEKVQGVIWDFQEFDGANCSFRLVAAAPFSKDQKTVLSVRVLPSEERSGSRAKHDLEILINGQATWESLDDLGGGLGDILTRAFQQ